MKSFFTTLTSREKVLFKKLNTPQKLQDFLESIPINFEKEGDTLYSPRNVLRNKKAHCFEGALFAAAVFWYHGKAPFLLDLKTTHGDDSHVVALFKEKGKWGAVSKTNHAVLRYRDPVYKTPRELAMSYFHEYFLDDGRKTLRSFAVFNLKNIKKNWVTDEKDLWHIDKAIDTAKHTEIVSDKNSKTLRKADLVERKAGKLITWKKR
jgi:hypothetical protein